LHLIPAGGRVVTEAMWLEAVRAHFQGKIIIGKDLMTI
jgi:hypothetical protein